MPVSLSKAHRKLLENTTAAARVLAESACRAALENLAVHEKEARKHMSAEQRQLRNRLRARGRAIGDSRDTRTGLQDIHHLIGLAAYEHWHRLLFTRFLTENHLLITDEANGSVSITLEECEELASELGARDGLDLACRFASRTLPGVFRRDDPVLDLPVALNDQVELRKLLGSLPSECFRADDALGWTYQFWQAQRKDEINDSGKKIGAGELAPVTQLFTEDYMVEFLLHNTIGAWWTGRLGRITAATEAEARAKATLPALDGAPAVSWTYLRFVQDAATQDWLPAAGKFEGWPKSAREIKVLDPCMGSGHFLVFALPLLVRLRMEDEKLSSKAAVVAVLGDNLHGLELDERCTQIAAFSLALTAWKLAGYQKLLPMNLACSGLAPSGTEAEWIALAGDDDRLRRGMARLHMLFKHAPVLGSLINPREQTGNLIESDYHELTPLLESAVAAEKKKTKENDEIELAVVAQGIAKAAELLAAQFTLVVTNVPYLGRGKQDEQLATYCEIHYPNSKWDLATTFVERSLRFAHQGGSAGLVAPQNWLFLGRYTHLRRLLLKDAQWDYIARLGPKAFQTPMWDFNVALIGLSNHKTHEQHRIFGLEVGTLKTPDEKAIALLGTDIADPTQLGQLGNPDSRVTFDDCASTPLLSNVAKTGTGMQTFDSPRFIALYWELERFEHGWLPEQSTVQRSATFGGRSRAVRWEDGRGQLFSLVQDMEAAGYKSGIWKAGSQFWGKRGVLVSLMGDTPATLYDGVPFDNNTGAIIPNDAQQLPAVWAYCSSTEFSADLRKVDQKINVTNATLAKVPFDFARWQKAATEKFPDGLPKPHNGDPTQWLFSGHPKRSDQPLHVAVARLLGYQWPRQNGSSFVDCPALGRDGLENLADRDGIVCLSAVIFEQPAASRLRTLLAAALGTFDERAIIARAGIKGSKSKTLDDWLRDEFFEQHAKLFHDRPFIWHLWDGRSDGFHALVNYHRLDHANLQKLTYSYLGDWIQQQEQDAKADKPGAAERLGAARALQNKLAAILEGEAPLDIFVRWKPLKEQAQGWKPDLNDGIRQNIRPFLFSGDVGKRGAGLFRTVPLSLKDKDRGTEPHRTKTDYPWFWCEEEPGTDPKGGKDFIGSRWNDVHLTLETKQKARGE